MKILAITQRPNNQRFQQTQNVTTINQAPKYDSVSFGMAKLHDDGLIRIVREILSREFVRYLITGDNSNAMKVIESLKTKQSSATLQKAFVELTDFTDGITSSSHFGLALEWKQPDVALEVLKLASEVSPKTVLEYQIPTELTQTPDFLSIAHIMATHKTLTKDETLTFLNKNNSNGILDRMIQVVKEHATD